MAKSVNDYYLEKMNKLLDMQQNTASSSKTIPLQAPSAKKEVKKEQGRDYYDKFRTKSKAEEQIRTRQEKAYAPPRVKISSSGSGQGQVQRPQQKHSDTNDRQTGTNRRPKQTPEQTQIDREREAEKRTEALEKAKRAKKLRKLRDAIVTFILVLAVFSVMCVVVYRLIFVVSDIKINGNKGYSAEEIAAASGVDVGDHLYSFRGSVAENSIILNCPMVSEVAVDRVAPKTVNFNVVEEPRAFYCNFYGEYRAMSPSLRVLSSIAEDDAKTEALIKIKLPVVKQAVAGQMIKFLTLESDDYMYEFCKVLEESELWERVTAIDLTSKYDIRFVCDGKYLLCVGDISHIETKLRIGATVLKDEQLVSYEKAKIDLTDLAETSVVEDSRLDLEW